jgi:hypothetical protein
VINTYDMRIALRDFEEAQDSAARAEDDRQRAWSAYLLARGRATDAAEALQDAERAVQREAGRLASPASRLNRDERRAQVLAGVDERFADIPF